jgi:hypothetical protein
MPTECSAESFDFGTVEGRAAALPSMPHDVGQLPLNKRDEKATNRLCNQR